MMQKKARLVAWAVTTDVRTARRHYFDEFGEEAPPRQSIHRWVERFLETGDINARKEGSGRPVAASGEDSSEKVKEAIGRDPTCSTRRLSSTFDACTKIPSTPTSLTSFKLCLMTTTIDESSTASGSKGSLKKMIASTTASTSQTKLFFTSTVPSTSTTATSGLMKIRMCTRRKSTTGRELPFGAWQIRMEWWPMTSTMPRWMVRDTKKFSIRM